MKVYERWVIRLAGLVAHTLRITWRGAQLPSRCIVLFWHEDMFCGWWLMRKSRPVALVSASKDGEILSNVLRKWGYQLARGSSSTGGKQALQRAIDLVRTGSADRIVITPDGPRGPRRILKRGGYASAEALGLPLYFLSFKCGLGKRLSKSWDKFFIPVPFASVVVRVSRLPIEGFPTEKDEQLAWLHRVSDELS